jgi:asparagine synthase (glutamine-hydrolysing)
MCGILGVIAAVPPTSVLDDALNTLKHRGPDSSGQCRFRSGNTDVWFGHTRLSILDLSQAGHQPMSSRDGSWRVTFNGEIYNHLDIRKDLTGPWRGHSDTETLVEALASWGLTKTLSRLNGMFAFAAADVARGNVHLCRDPFGIKPIYYTNAGKTICFSSEIKALVKLTGHTYPIDDDALQTFMSLRFIPSPFTLLDGIKRLPPGHFISIDLKANETALHRYIRPTTERFGGSIADAVGEYKELMKRAVHRQMLSDVPVGIFLSSGVDSSFVAAIAAEQGTDTPCYSVGFGPQFPECELDAATKTAQLLGLKMNPTVVTPDDLWNAFEACVSSIEEPLGTSSVLPMWHLSRRAGENVKVVLTGQGSDEPWGGYRRYQAELWRDLPFVRLMARLGSPILEGLPRVPDFVLRALDSMPISDMSSRFEREYCLLFSAEREALTGRGDYGGAGNAIGYWLDWASGRTASDGAEMMMTIDSRMGLADDLLLYGDKISMAHSLETRVPMLDVELVRFIESLPRHYRVSFTQGKIVHKLAAEQMLSGDIVYRKKKGFPMPFGDWIRNVWRDRVEAALFEDGALHLNWMSRDGMRRIWEEHQQGRRDRSRQIFALLAFAFWCKTMAPLISV